MKWCLVVFQVENCVHLFLHLVLRRLFNYQTFLCIRYHVSSDLFTLWNAYTSYELSRFLSRTQICEHFKDLTINTLKSKPSLFVKLLGYAIYGNKSWERKHLKCNSVCPTNSAITERFPSSRPSQVGDLCFLSFSNLSTTFKIKACGKWSITYVWRYSLQNTPWRYSAMQTTHR